MPQEELRQEKQVGRPVNCSDSELSTYLLALGEEFLPTFYVDTSQFARLKSMSIASKSYQRGKKTVIFHGFPSLQMSRSSVAGPGGGESTSLVEDSPVRISPAQGRGLGLPVNEAVCGESSRASSKKFDRRRSLSKTPRTFALADLSPSSKTLPAWGSMRVGVCSERMPLELPIPGKECGLLPTPTGAGNECSPSMMKWPRHRRLMELFARLPSPRHTDADRGGRGNSNSHFKLPTPTARLYGSNQGGASGRAGQKRRPSLEALTGGPWMSFREWMMGWPIGWTELRPLAMGKFQEWLHWHGGF